MEGVGRGGTFKARRFSFSHFATQLLCFLAALPSITMLTWRGNGFRMMPRPANGKANLWGLSLSFTQLCKMCGDFHDDAPVLYIWGFSFSPSKVMDRSGDHQRVLGAHQKRQ
jgi:hypothetical protein